MILLCVCVGQRNLFISASPLSLKLSWPGSRRKVKKPDGIIERGLHTSRVSLGSGRRGSRFKTGLNESVTGRKSMSDHLLGVRESERKGEKAAYSHRHLLFPSITHEFDKGRHVFAAGIWVKTVLVSTMVYSALALDAVTILHCVRASAMAEWTCVGS